jgi:A/G-specific adenine glycosylase
VRDRERVRLRERSRERVRDTGPVTGCVERERRDPLPRPSPSPFPAPSTNPLPVPLRTSLRRRLLAWWDAGHRDLPWRAPQGRADPYLVLVAEVMLQQTQVAVVVPYYRRFTERFPTLEALARAPEEDVLALWSGLGYYARARRLREAAQAALARHGELPRDEALLGALPGFGPYTAGAVASIAFGAACPAVDGNAARVLARLFLVAGPVGSSRVRQWLQGAARALVPRDRPGDFNQALMELGATTCTARGPRCGSCPLSALCAARRAGREREVPAARARARRARLTLACAVVERGRALLLARRQRQGLFGGLWELPCAEVDGAADPRAALRRALLERHGLAVDVREELASARRTLTHRDLQLIAYRCSVRGVATTQWLRFAPISELEDLALSTAVRRLIETLPGLGRGSPQNP